MALRNALPRRTLLLLAEFEFPGETLQQDTEVSMLLDKRQHQSVGPKNIYITLLRGNKNVNEFQ
jgi:hypothetical protein